MTYCTLVGLYNEVRFLKPDPSLTPDKDETMKYTIEIPDPPDQIGVSYDKSSLGVAKEELAITRRMTDVAFAAQAVVTKDLLLLGQRHDLLLRIIAADVHIEPAPGGNAAS